MKATIELSDILFRTVEATASARGQTLMQFVTEALEEKVAQLHNSNGATEPPWTELFGGLAHLHEENQRILAIIEEEFEQIDAEDRT